MKVLGSKLPLNAYILHLCYLYMPQTEGKYRPFCTVPKKHIHLHSSAMAMYVRELESTTSARDGRYARMCPKCKIKLKDEFDEDIGF